MSYISNIKDLGLLGSDKKIFLKFFLKEVYAKQVTHGARPFLTQRL